MARWWRRLRADLQGLGRVQLAQGAMVLFAALAMARFAEWIPKWTGIDNPIVANLAAFVIAGAMMFVVAWLIERWCCATWSTRKAPRC
jgi:branched-subunit amino acid ABC-type transport system permease component